MQFNPTGGILPLDPAAVNPPDYVAPKPPNKSREYSADRDNKTLFIGSIDCGLTEQEIRKLFLNFGEITYVNKPHHSNAFVQFAQRRDAQMAMRQMQGVPIKACRLRISWGDPKSRNQCDIKEKIGWKPLKGHKYQHIQTKEKPQHTDQNDWHPQSNPYGGFDMSGPWAQQRLYQMAYAPHYSMVWHPPQWYQYPYQQQMGYGYQHMGYGYQQMGYDHQQMGYGSQQMGYGYQHPYPPPPPPPPPVGSAEQNSQPAPPEGKPGNHEFSLNHSVSTWVQPSTGNKKTNGPLVVSSDMAPKPYQRQWPAPTPAPCLRQWPAPRSDSTSSLESDQSKASSGTGNSRETTGKTSPDQEPQPGGDSETVIGVEGELQARLQELTISMRDVVTQTSSISVENSGDT